jgi:hypothetical protein
MVTEISIYGNIKTRQSLERGSDMDTEKIQKTVLKLYFRKTFYVWH